MLQQGRDALRESSNYLNTPKRRQNSRLFGVFKYGRKRIITRKSAPKYKQALLVVVCLFVPLGVLFSVMMPRVAHAATSSTLNFQARLLSNTGAVVPDGTYNIEFNLYTVSSGGSTLWTEDYLNNASQGVTLKYGYFSVALGSLTSFPSTINWDQELWLGMTVRGTGSCAFSSCTPTDSEMNPRFKLTAVPYAFSAGQLQKTSGASTLKVQVATPTANVTYTFQDAVAGSYDVCTTASVCSGYAASSGSANYIQNQNAVQQTSSNFWISGSGRADTSFLSLAYERSATGTLLLGTTATTTSLIVGSTSLTGVLTLDSGAASTINIGSSANARTVNLATGAATQTVTIGSTTSTSSLTLQAGTGALSLQTQGTGGINIGTNAVAQNIMIGNSTGGTIRVGQNGGTLQLDGTNFDVSTAGIVTVAGGQTADIQSSAGTSLKVYGGSSTAALSNGGSVTLQGGDATVNATNGGNVTIDAGSGNSGIGGVNGDITVGTTNARNVTLGRTGAITTNINGSTINIGNGGTANTIQIGNTTGAVSQTINVGTNATASSSTSLTIGSAIGASPTVIQSGTSGTIVKAITSSTSAFQIQNSATASVYYLNLDSANSRLQIVANQENAGYLNTPNGGFGSYSNLLTYSEQINNAAWTASASVTADNQVAPDGNTTAEQVIDIGGANTVYNSSSTAVGGTYTFSVWVKLLGGTAAFDLQINGTASGTGTAATYNATSTWTRYSVTQNTASFTGNVRVLISPGSGGAIGNIAVWGAQLVSGSSPGIYIPTTSTTVSGGTGFNATGLITLNNSGNLATNINTGTSTGAVTIGNSAAGAITLQGSASSTFIATSGSFTSTLGFTTPTANQTYNLPNSPAGTYTICTTANNCTGLTAYIQNQTTLQTTANFNIQSAATGSVTANFRVLGSQTAEVLRVRDSADTTTLFSVSPAGNMLVAGTATINGNTTIQTTSNSTTAFQIQNSAATNLVTVDTTNMRLVVNGTLTTMSTPNAPTLGTVAGGSLTASTTYYYKVTAIDGQGGETAASSESSIATTGTNKTINVSITVVSGATAYKIYRATSSNAEVYLTTIAAKASLNSYSDSGSVTVGTATPPSTTTAYTAAANYHSSSQLVVGAVGKPTGQVYIGGQLSTTPVIDTNIGLAGTDIKVRGGYAYVVGNTSLKIFDVSVPSAPTLMSTTTVPSSSSLDVQGRYAYIYGSGNTLRIYDISNVAAPVQVSSTAITSSNGQKVIVRGRYAYFGDYLYISVYDISNPASPTRAGTIRTGASAGSVNMALQGDYLYVSNSSTGNIKVYDISNPSAITNTNTLSLTHTYAALVASGRNLYVAYTSLGTPIFSIMDISTPSIIGSSVGYYPSTAVGRSLIVTGNYAYMPMGTSIEVADITNPSYPVSVGTITNSSNYIDVVGRYVYGVNSSSKFIVSDLGGTYSQSLESGSLETTSAFVGQNLAVRQDTSIGGGLKVDQGAQLNGNVGIAGKLNATSTVTIQSATNSTVALSALTSSGDTVLNVDTTNSRLIIAGLAAPTGVSVSAATAGGSLATNTTYYIKVTAIDAAGGESTASSEASGTTSTTNLTLPISWTAVNGAVSYRVYYGTTTGSQAAYYTSGTNSYSLSAAAGTADSPPIASSAGFIRLDGSNNVFQSKTNSTTAFQVQNQAGTSLLTVDTTNTTISIAANTTITGLTTGDALTVNNSTSTGNIFVAKDNGTAVVTISDGGAATFQNTTDSTAALTVKDTTGVAVLNVDTSSAGNNLVSNSGFETNTTGWSAKGSASISRITTQQLSGVAALQLSTTAAANDGVSFSYTFTASTTYTLSLYVKSTSAFSTFVIGRQDQSGTDTNCQTGIVVITTWLRVSCTFTTGGTISSSNFYIKQSDATARTLYVDNVQLEAGSYTTPYNGGGIIRFDAAVIQGATSFLDGVSIGNRSGVYDRQLLVGSTTQGTRSILAVTEEVSDMSSVYTRGVNASLRVNPSVTGSAGAIGLVGRLDTVAGNTNTLSAIIGVRTDTNNNQSGTVSELSGANLNASNKNGSGAVTTLNGAIIGATNESGAGAVTSLYGLQATAQNASASGVSSLYGGTFISSNTAGAVGTLYGSRVVSSNSSASGVTNLYGQSIANSSSAGTTTVLLGNDVASTLTGGSATYFGGIRGVADLQSSGSVSGQFYGFKGEAKISSGATNAPAVSVNGVWGEASNYSTLTVSNINGFTTNLLNNTTGTVTNMIGYYATTPQNSSGTITNAYGVYVQSQTAGTNDYGIYIQGADSYALWSDDGVNRLDGSTYIGTGLATGDGLTVSNGTSTGNILVLNDNSTAVLSVTDGGSVLFKNATNSTTAFQIQDASATALLNVDTTNDLLTLGGNLIAVNAATATTGTTEATARTNVTTVTLTAAGSFANNDIIFINNAGQDYYTRITAGGGTTTLTVSPAVSYDASASVTKYTAQNIGATSTDYTTQTNRFFQGYFLGGVVTGAGSTTLSDQNIKSTGSLYVKTGGDTTRLTVDSSGNVGIGISSSLTAPLEVSGAIRSSYINDRRYRADLYGWNGWSVLNSYDDTGGSYIDLLVEAQDIYFRTGPSGTVSQTLLLSSAGDATLTGNLTVNGTGASTIAGTLTVNNEITIDSDSANYDVWIQGSAQGTAAGDARNLALLGNSSTDDLILNFNNEYDCVSIGGTSCSAALSVNGSISFVDGTYQAAGSGSNVPVIFSSADTNTGFLMDSGTPDTFRLITGGYSAFGCTLSANCNVGGGSANGAAGSANFTVYGRVATCTLGGGTGATNCTSDSRKKHDIASTTDNLAKILHLNPVSFRWNSQGDSGPTRLGLIAQEVLPYFPEAVTTDDEGFYSLDYAVLTSPLIGAVKELKVYTDSINQRLSVIESGQIHANLHVYGDTVVDGTLSVIGDTTLQNLTVVGMTTVQSITVEGKIVTAGSAPTVTADSLAGYGASVTISGNDTAGTITLTTGVKSLPLYTLAAGGQASATFSSQYNTAPRIALTPKNTNAGQVRYYVSTTATGFTINFVDTPASATDYQFDYIVVQ